jgi:hypothetical protein
VCGCATRDIVGLSSYHYNYIRRRKLIGDYIPYRRLIVYYAVFEREGVVCEWL